MNEDASLQTINLFDIAGDITRAFVSNNPIPAAELPSLFRHVHAALNDLATNMAVVPSQSADELAEKPTAAQIRKSVTPDGIVSFVDGKTYKTMKRHLATQGFDPYSYRERFGLPADYPMVAPNYAAQRSALAKAMGLGRAFGEREPTKPMKAPGGEKAA